MSETFNTAIREFEAKNYAYAYDLFEEAARTGDINAQYALGAFYERGMLGGIDEDKALEYFKKAADCGHIDAQLKTGLLYRQKGEIFESMRYLITAAHNNNRQAQSIITYVSNSSLSAEKNEAFHLLEESKQRALVEELLQTKIRPMLAGDGGGIELVHYAAKEKPQVWLNYQGACSGCHLSFTSTADMLLDHFETMIDKNVVLYLM
ncbi:NifU family protein [Sulfurimonas sp. HSL-1716]|uniref:NifU family protein n=1 Tax=Hydrocurvibacter sulfurireducens TaxID=3131937 RepID=UPI0031F8AA15